MGPLLRKPSAELAIDWANDHEGLARRADLQRLGMTTGTIRSWRETGRLHEHHPGVYSLGHRVLTTRGRHLAAIWWAGEDAVLSHLCAAAFHRLTDAECRSVHVTVTGRRRSRQGITVHRTRNLSAPDVLPYVDLPVTTKERTFVDCADVLGEAALRAIADRFHVLPVAGIRAVVGRAPFKPGAALVSTILDGADAHTRSEFERRYLRLTKGLPHPSRLNAQVAGHQADVVFDDERVLFELDGRSVHQRAMAMREDRRKDADYQRAGWFIRRWVWDDFSSFHLAGTLDEIGDLLGLRRNGP